MKPTLTVLSLGAGVQSTTLALRAASGETEKPNAAIFADTGWEPPAVYEHFARLTPVLEQAGIEVRIVKREPDLRTKNMAGGRIQLPVFVATLEGTAAPSIRECTREYKLRPITREVRTLLGYPGRKRVPKDVYVEQWIGFSTDETFRVSGKSDAPFLHSRYPLIEAGLSRKDCTRYLRAHGWTVAKSACIGCPFHGNRTWREMRDERPEEWASAVEFDRALRGRPMYRGLKGEPYLHRSLLPLDEAPIDRLSRRDWKNRQGDLLDLAADTEAGVSYDPDEEGDPDGCGPFACRSGEPV